MRRMLGSAPRIVLPGLLLAMIARGEPNGTDTTPEPSGQLIEGIVLNYQGGGIANAEIRIESIDADLNTPPLAKGTTNEFGDIKLQLPKAVKGPVRVRIVKQGYTDWIQEINPDDEDDPPFIDATMEGAATLSGRVSAAYNGQPVAGASVECDNGGRNLQMRTDDAGRYRIENVFLGPTMLKVTADGFAIARSMVVIESEQQNYDVELRAERRVELLIATDHGQPAGKVTVEALTEPDQNYHYALTGPDGRAILKGIPADCPALHLRINGDDYVQMPGFDHRFELPPEPTSSTADGPTTRPAPARGQLTVKLGGRVTGKVIESETRQPVVGVRVIAGRELVANQPMVWTSIAGTYELAGLTPGTNLLSFQHDDYAPEIHEVQITAGQSSTLNIRLKTGQPIAGKVVDQDGQPLEQVWITATNWKGHATLGLGVITDEQGRFSIANAPQGDIEFRILKPGFAPPVDRIMIAGKTDYEIVVEQQEPPSESGMSIDAKLAVGDTVPDLAITATDGTVYKLADLRGRYVFIDCWATWCGPCIAELPHLKAVRAAFKGHADFLMIGVSLDRDRKAFNKVVKDKEIDWPQVFGEKSGASELFQAFDGLGIPYICLIGPDGKLIAHHLRGEDMVKTVREHLKPQHDGESAKP